MQHAGIRRCGRCMSASRRRRPAVDAQGQRPQRSLSGVSRWCFSVAEIRRKPRHDRVSERCSRERDWISRSCNVSTMPARRSRDELGSIPTPTRSKSITAEQMLDAIPAGVPPLQKHWSFGKHFAYDEAFYRKGPKGLADEIVINSSPSYFLSDGRRYRDHADAVIAYVVFGHNHFFKNTISFANGRMPRQFLDRSRFRQELRGAGVRSVMAASRSSDARRGAC